MPRLKRHECQERSRAARPLRPTVYPYIGLKRPRLETRAWQTSVHHLDATPPFAAAPLDRRRWGHLPVRVRLRPDPPPGRFRRNVDGVPHFLSSQARPRTCARLRPALRVRLVHRLGGARRGAPARTAGAPGRLAAPALRRRRRCPDAHWKLARSTPTPAPTRPLAWIDDAHDDDVPRVGRRAPRPDPARHHRPRRRARPTSTSRHCSNGRSRSVSITDLGRAQEAQRQPVVPTPVET